jgi:predicted ester cyclase
MPISRSSYRLWAIRVPDVNQYVVDGYTDHNPPPIQGLASGATGLRQVFAAALQGFGEFHHVIEASIAEGDKVASRVTGYGKHTGNFLGIPPTGKDVTMSGITIHRMTNGKLSEHWAQIDALSVLQQFGVVPPPSS